MVLLKQKSVKYSKKKNPFPKWKKKSDIFVSSLIIHPSHLIALTNYNVSIIILNTLCTIINYLTQIIHLTIYQFFLSSFNFVRSQQNVSFALKTLSFNIYLRSSTVLCFFLFNWFKVGNEREKMETREFERKMFHYISSFFMLFAHSPCFIGFYSAYKLFSLNNYCLQKKFPKKKT